ncbi:MAG: tRNA 5-methoxyuridine(34)/uridine 5-oxyacetic acid(34) synthase CmoB [Porticoccaceae bacterium]
MPDYQSLLQWMSSTQGFETWSKTLPEQLQQGLSRERWGDLPQWQQVIDALPNLSPSSTDFATTVRIGEHRDCDDDIRNALKNTLMGLHPWRKGPWQLFGLDIDTEWRSDWKWDRLAPHLDSLAGQRILDVGCGNGYHCMRLYGCADGHSPERVIGIDPSAKFVYQFQVFKHYCPEIPVDVLPLGIEQLPANLRSFDTVLSMGVIYHRKDPRAHIQELCDCLKPGGRLILETLVVDSKDSLIPQGRYAKMRNVWCVPSIHQVLEWMTELKLKHPRMVDCGITTIEEQRRTPWMRFESLPDFLDPENQELTVEGYPAPRRALFTASV